MFQRVISAKGFWRSVSTLALGFIIIYNVIDVWFAYDFDWSLYAENRFAEDNLLRFFVANIMSGFAIGAIVMVIIYIIMLIKGI